MKKTWIKIKRGLLQPKHRRQMGERIWLYLYILDRADWETGKVLEWVDESEAEQLEMPIRTLREWRRQLQEDGYIICEQKQRCQTLSITNWIDPRNYSGEILNKRETFLDDYDDCSAQGDIQGSIQGSTQHVTPTSNSHNHIIISDDSKSESSSKPIQEKPDAVDMMLRYSRKSDPINDYDECYRPYLEVLRDKFGVDAPAKGERGWKMWCGELLILRRTCNNSVSELEPVYADWKAKPWIVASPRNLERAVIGKRGQQKSGAGEKPRQWAQEY